jgi:hypothetical protein
MALNFIPSVRETFFTSCRLRHLFGRPLATLQPIYALENSMHIVCHLFLRVGDGLEHFQLHLQDGLEMLSTYLLHTSHFRNEEQILTLSNTLRIK